MNPGKSPAVEAHLVCAHAHLRKIGLALLLALLAGAMAGRPAMAQRPLGIDVSYWQGDLSQATWNSVYAAGRTFAFARCTHWHGTGESDAHGDPDPTFANNMTRARAAGILIGAYHFARPSKRDPQTEATAFVNYATVYFGGNYLSSGYLRPVLDLEDGGGTTPVGATNLSNWANAWLDAVEAATGVEPMVYCNSNYANNYLNSTLSSRTLWIANYICSTNPQTGSPTAGIGDWSTWTFWQYCSSLSVGGISPVDTDVFNGTAAQLQNYVIGGGSAPPVISNVQAGSITNTSATITWTTNTASSSQVQYGLTTGYGSSSPLDSNQVTSHSVSLSGLSPNTLYHYRAISTNTNGTTNSSDFTFTTLGPPAISSPAVISIGPVSATVTWTTSVAATSQVRYGLTTGYGSQTALDSSLLTSHSVTITGLSPATLYHCQALSTNAYGSAQSSDLIFTTAGPPVITNVAVSNLTSTSASISWTTDAASDSQVEYGPTTSYGSIASNASMVTSHAVSLSGLTISTLYHYRVRSVNAGGTTYSGDFTFTTSAFSGDVIVDNLDPGFAYLVPTNSASWSTGSASSHYDTDYFWGPEATSTAESAATYKARWTPTLPVAGTWDVYIWYASGSNRTTNSYWKIFNRGATINLRVNQRQGGNGWTLLASDVPFDAGTAGNVQMWNNTGYTGYNRVVQGDAVRFVLSAADSQPPTVPTNLVASVSSTTAVQLNWSASSDDYLLSGYKIYRNGSYLASTSNTTYTDSTCSPNTTYSFELSAYDGTGNESSRSAAAVKTTLSVPPAAGSVVSDASIVCVGSSVTWTAVGGFGPGTVQYYRYAWDQIATHSFTGAEPQWTGGTLPMLAGAAGTWYLHVQGLNADNVANGIFHYSVIAEPCGAPTVSAVVSRKIHGAAGAMDIDVFSSSAVEHRQNGPTQLLITFTGPVAGLGGLDASDVLVTSGGISSLSIAGSVLTLNLTGVSDRFRFAIAFPGIVGEGGNTATTSTLCFGTLLGDVDGYGLTNVLDLVTVRNHIGQPVGAANFRNDQNADGTINILDLVGVRNALGNTISGVCP